MSHPLHYSSLHTRISPESECFISPSALVVLTELPSSWNVRFYGLAYKQANISTSDLDSIIDGLSTNNLNSTQQQLLQNRTAELASLPIPSANLTAVISANGSEVTNSSGIRLATSDDFGEFDQFVTISGLGNETGSVQVVETGLVNVTGQSQSR